MALSFEDQCRELLDADAAINSEPDSLGDGVEAENSVSTARSDVSHVGQRGHHIKRETFIRGLVDQIHGDSYQAFYRGRPHGDPVQGWRERLDTYFWPNPTSDVSTNSRKIEQIINRLKPLVQLRIDNADWSDIQEKEALQVTEDIFRWGGVTKSIKNITANNVRSTVDSAIRGARVDNAPMNSAWTKLAAFASSIADTDQAIWDSRVSHSLITRLKSLGATSDIFPALGWIGGQGGTRRTKGSLSYVDDWPNGYGKWDAHFAGAQVIREIRDELNGRFESAKKDASSAPWSIREVEMVLFMDGY
jgi:hypothetical protein